MQRFSFLAGPYYGANIIRNLQDDCWDTVCPTFKKDEKLNCLSSNSKSICDCCKKRNTPDCKVLVPGYGLYDACNPPGNLINPPVPPPVTPPVTPPATPPSNTSDTTVNSSKESFFEKNKVYIYSGIGIIILLIIMFIIFKFYKKQNKRRRRK
jgi:hypothetical protein